MARRRELLGYKEYQELVASRRSNANGKHQLSGFQDVSLEWRLTLPSLRRPPLNPLVVVELSPDDCTTPYVSGETLLGAPVAASPAMHGNGASATNVRAIMESIHLAAIAQPSETRMVS